MILESGIESIQFFDIHIDNPSIIDDFTDPDLAQDDDDFNANPYTWIDDYHDESV